ncbi:MAG: metallophosphoesterase [Rhodobacteraceae bacterium]|nr:metallophosphoesterase [Paracoccaceae bacterium]
MPKLRIAMVADLHACTRFMDEARVAQIVQQTQALNADLICLMGDYPGHLRFSKPLAPQVVARHLAELEAPMGVFAVFGNHDWHNDPVAKTARASRTKWHDAFEAAGLTTLVNTHVTLNANGVPLTLAGVDSQRAYHSKFQPVLGADDLPAALTGSDPQTFAILLAHEPDLFPTLPGHVDLMLSGHMHGGQIRPFGRALYAPSRFGTRYAYGHYVERAQQLVVSGGLGYSSIPLRWGMPSELTLVELS